PAASITVIPEGLIIPSPFRSCWKLGSSAISAGLAPGTKPMAREIALPLLSVFHTVYRSTPVLFRATSYPPAVGSAPIGAQPSSWPATTGAPPNFSVGPDDPPTGLRK